MTTAILSASAQKIDKILRENIKIFFFIGELFIS